MTRVAAIDLGTNSFLCLIADVEQTSSGPQLKVVEDHCKVVRLGEKVHENRRFLPEALARAKACLVEFSKVIAKTGATKVIATATSAARDASNGSELLEIGHKLNIPIHIIEGSKEAQLSFEGAVSAVADARSKKILVIDVGGGSTELIFREPGENIKGHSYDVGCVRLTEMFLKSDPPSATEIDELSAYAKKIMSHYGSVSPDTVIAVAGTPTTLACVAQEIDFDEEKVEGYSLTRKDLKSLLNRLGSMPLHERKKIKGLEPLRADVILAGCVLLERGLDLAGKNEMTVSTRGLRFGTALRFDEF